MIIPLAKENKFLLKECKKYDFSNENHKDELLKLYNDLVNIMRENKGLGLAANQIEKDIAAFVIEGIPQLFVNPKIIEFGEEKELMEEGCLSYPNFFVKIKRSKMIKLEYTDYLNQTKQETFSGLTSRIIQHEMDHINGKLFYHLVSRYHLDKAKKKLNSQK